MDKFDGFVENQEQLEEDLRHCLQHVPAPEGFTDRVMARVAEREAARSRKPQRIASVGFGGMHRNAGWWTAIAAMLLLAVGGDVMHERHERREREAAEVQAQMDLALQLTSHALDHVQGGIERSPAGRYTKILDELGK